MADSGNRSDGVSSSAGGMQPQGSASRWSCALGCLLAVLILFATGYLVFNITTVVDKVNPHITDI